MYAVYLLVCNHYLQDLDDTGLTGFQKLVENPNVTKNVVFLLNKVLQNKYPKFSTSKVIEVQELLTWKLWPDIIKIFGERFRLLYR